jgi:uncharacterized RDD family membrane protein YckC
MYYLHLDGKQDGPFSYEHLRAGWRDGSLRPDTLFWQEGMEEWQPLETLRKQFETAPPAVSESPESPDAAAPMIIAGFWRRLAAFLVDVLILGIAGFASGYFLFHFYMELGIAGILIGLVVATAYFGLLNSSLGSGRTLGKRLLGIRVEDANGNLISPARSILRYLILAFPFFLEKALLDGLIPNLTYGALASIPVVAAFTAFTYLLIFNRRSRQLVHDLAVKTYVVRVISPRPALAPALWRGHAVVIGILCLLIAVLGCLSPILLHLPGFEQMQAVRQSILNTGEARAVTVSGGKTYFMTAGQVTTTRVFTILAHVKEPPASSPATAAHFVALAEQADPTVVGYDRIDVSITYGYDIGIAFGDVSDQYSHTPDEWRQLAAK